MTRSLILLATLACLATPMAARAQSGNGAAGKAFWDGGASMCRQCHGANGEGGFGPDLAGRAMTPAQFARAVRQPWGVMPAFTREQVSDQQVANLVAYFDSLPRVAEPGPWRTPVVATAPAGQQLAAAQGCAQCHGAELAVLRQALGAAAVDFPWFTRLVYTHTDTMPELERMLGDSAPIRMGNYSPLRVPEPVLQEIWKYITDLGPRARVQAQMARGTAVTNGTAYAVTVTNRGLPNKGPAAEDVTVAINLPAGATIVGTTGAGYQGVQKDDKGLDVATWRVPRLAATEAQTFGITLAPGAAVPAGSVRWMKPAQKTGAAGDTVPIAPPRP